MGLVEPSPGSSVVALWIAVWQEEGGSQCPVFRTHEPGPRQLCPWHSKPQSDELGVGCTESHCVKALLLGLREKQGLVMLS